jgi:protein TonB
MHLSGGRGLINLQITLDADGKVAEIRRTSAQLVQPTSPINSAEDRETTGALVKSAIAAAREWTFAPPAEGPLTFQAAFMFFNGTVDVVLAPPASARGRGAGGTVTGLAATLWAAAEGAYRIGGDIPAPRKTKDAKPEYPREAQEKRIQGVVILEAVIGPNGKVRDARVLRSVPGLDQAALATLRKWEYTPTQRNGVAVPVVMTVTMTFTLN